MKSYSFPPSEICILLQVPLGEGHLKSQPLLPVGLHLKSYGQTILKFLAIQNFHDLP